MPLPEIATTVDPEHRQAIPTGAEMVPVLQRIFTAQEKETLGRLRRYGVKDFDDVPPAYDLSHWDGPMARETYDVVELWYDYGGQRAESRLGQFPEPWDVKLPHIQEAVSQQAFTLSAAANGVTQSRLNAVVPLLRQEISQGLFLGDPLKEIKTRIESVFTEARGSRAELIAATESSRAVHAGQILAAEQSGVVIGKQLLLSSDACPLCVAVAAENEGRLVGLREAFAVIGNHPDYSVIQSPPIHPRCRCAMIDVVIEVQRPREEIIEAENARREQEERAEQQRREQQRLREQEQQRIEAIKRRIRQELERQRQAEQEALRLRREEAARQEAERLRREEERRIETERRERERQERLRREREASRT